MSHLDVYLNATCVGQLTQEDARLGFVYRGDYLRDPLSVPLSRQLSLRPDPFAEPATRAFFANLLPEGAVLDQVARRLGRSRDNVFGLLELLGGDCAGAVEILPPGQLPSTTRGCRSVTDGELAAILASLPTHPLLADEDGIRLSLAGAQNKLPVIHDGGGFLIPQGEVPSSHILKTAIPVLENTVANEAFCMHLAGAIGLPVPLVTVVKVGEGRVYMIERYDRIKLSSGQMVRIHQEDLCQALGVLPALKYESEGGPGFSGIFALVRKWSTEPLPDILLLLQWALFNFLIGNADAHGKNLSFLPD